METGQSKGLHSNTSLRAQEKRANYEPDSNGVCLHFAINLHAIKISGKRPAGGADSASR